MNLKDYFQTPSLAAPRRLIVQVNGMQKTGKTTLGLSAPKPLAIINFDIGLEGVIQRFAEDVTKGNILVMDMKSGEYLLQQNLGQDVYEAEWRKFVSGFRIALRECKSVMVDTAPEAWELCRLAHFGRLSQVMQHHYAIPNAAFRQLLREAYEHEVNLILVHHLKAEYVGNTSTGNKVPAGFSRTADLVQMVVYMWRDENNEFCLRIADCRHKPQLNGTVLFGGMINFEYLLSMVHD